MMAITDTRPGIIRMYDNPFDAPRPSVPGECEMLSAPRPSPNPVPDRTRSAGLCSHLIVKTAARVVRLPFLGLIMFAAAVLARGDTSAVEKRILELQQQLRKAFLQHDGAALNRLLADDWKVVHVNGREQTKAQFIESLESGRAKFLSIDMDQITVRFFGTDTAIVTARWSNKIEFRGEQTSGQDRVTTVWVKQGGVWRDATDQASFVEDSRPPASGQPSNDARDILRLESAIEEAWLKHDTTTISSIIADDFQSWSFRGVRRGKGDVLRAVEKNEESDTKVEDPVVRIYGDAAVYTARVIDTGKHADGRAFMTKTSLTGVFVRRGGKWQLVAEHETLLPE